jgi:CheY-like chemotaxis protein
MNAQPRMVLLVEDEETITVPLTEALAREGFRTETAGTLAAGLEIARRERPDLVLLDVMLPDGSGFDLLRELRDAERMPVIMLTARGEEADRVLGLELGADDYVVKPFSARELVARIRAVLRRTSAAATPAPNGPLQIGAVELDASARTVTLDGQPSGAHAQGVRPPRPAHGPGRDRREPRAAHRRGLGRQLVRLDQDARRPRQRPAQEARRRLVRSPATCHTVRGVGFRFARSVESDAP